MEDKTCWVCIKATSRPIMTLNTHHWVCESCYSKHREALEID